MRITRQGMADLLGVGYEYDGGTYGDDAFDGKTFSDVGSLRDFVVGYEYDGGTYGDDAFDGKTFSDVGADEVGIVTVTLGQMAAFELEFQSLDSRIEAFRVSTAEARLPSTPHEQDQSVRWQMFYTGWAAHRLEWFQWRNSHQSDESRESFMAEIEFAKLGVFQQKFMVDFHAIRDAWSWSTSPAPSPPPVAPPLPKAPPPVVAVPPVTPEPTPEATAPPSAFWRSTLGAAVLGAGAFFVWRGVRR